MKRKSPLLEGSLKYITEYLQSEKMPTSGRLPPLRELAQGAGVSIFTMSTAVQKLASKGIVEIVSNSGIWKTGCTPKKKSSQDASVQTIKTRQKKWETIRSLLLKDIFAGRYNKDHNLPNLKEMAVMYSTCPKTLRPAIDSLIADNVICRFKRGLKIKSAAQPRSRAMVILVVQRGLPVPTQRIYQILEETCSINNINLTIAWFDYDRGSLVNLQQLKNDIAGHMKHNAVIGFILMSGAHILIGQLFDQLLTELSMHKLPVSILGSGPAINLSPYVKKYPICSFHNFNRAGNVGAAVGTYLLEMGHRHMAYFAFVSSHIWTYNRYYGLADAIIHADDNARIEVYLINYGPEGEIPQQQAVDAELLAPWNLPTAAKPNKRQRQEGSHSLAFSNPNIVQVDYAHEAVDMVLKNKSISVIVAESDTGAKAILPVLHAIRAKIPEKISIIGFDNTTESLLAGLTTFSHNDNGLASSALNYILNFSLFKRGTSSRVFQIEGAIIPRTTVASVVSV